MRGLIGFSLAIIVASIFAGCSDHGSPVEVDTPPVENGPVSFADDIQPIFNSNCIGCHGAGGNAGLDLRDGLSYDNLVGVDAVNSTGFLVTAGDADASVLQRRLNGVQSGFMPPGGALQQSSRDLVIEWINNGALNN